VKHKEILDAITATLFIASDISSEVTAAGTTRFGTIHLMSLPLPAVMLPTLSDSFAFAVWFVPPLAAILVTLPVALDPFPGNSPTSAVELVVFMLAPVALTVMALLEANN